MAPRGRTRRAVLAAGVVGAVVVAVAGLARASATTTGSVEAAGPSGTLVGSADTLEGLHTLGTPDETGRRATFVARATGTWMPPVLHYVVTARFGERGQHWQFRHTGLDFKAPTGTPVYAVTDGVVVKISWHKAYGNMVILETAPGVTLWYCHLSAVTTRLGPVQVGEQLGRVGQTGNATGPHLHLEVRVHDRPTDPQRYLFGMPPGHPGTPPGWLPPTPVLTVAGLPQRG